jgi:DNA mismatch endonuclease (patch repair protein)
MSAVRSANTTPELRLRRALHARGLRFRLHRRNLPGSPDLVLPRFDAAVFVHGCFWHRHPGCPRTTTPVTRTDYWGPKFTRNIERDRAAITALMALGWRVAVIWECALGVRKTPETADALVVWLHGDAPRLELP